MENEGAVVLASPQDLGISVARDPKAVIAEAYNAAKALKDIIDAKPENKKVMMGGEQYIEFDDWQMLGKFYGITAKVASTEYVEIGGARGFNARAIALHGPTGQEVSAAESLCLNDEDKWSTRSKYVRKDGKKEKVGDVAVPLFQLKSMAQTRACAKALRNVLSGIVVLAGYKATVFEEMTGDEPEAQREAKPPIQQPKPKEAAPATATVPSTPTPQAGAITFVPTKIGAKADKRDKMRYSVLIPSGQWAATYDKALYDIVEGAKKVEQAITVTVEKDGDFTNLKSAVLAPEVGE